MLLFHRYIYLWGLLILLCTGCANVLTPNGGPRDITPPNIVDEKPANKSNHFKHKTIKITFNEYFTLNNPNDNILISPPLATKPIFSINNKTLSITFTDTLISNQTYNIGFIGSIRDFTENNTIPFYNYAFTTGDAIDSFQLTGKVIQAENNEPIKDCFVFAYINDIDSLPYTQRPNFMTKTRDNGTFSIQNIPSNNYKIFALKDINNNLLFDLSNESIAFLPSPVPATIMPIEHDTISTDSTLNIDSIPTSSPIELQFFTEEDTFQTYVQTLNPLPGKYEIIYKNRIRKCEITPLVDSISFFQHISNDTITLYFKQTLKDTMALIVTVQDSLCDTLHLAPYNPKKKARSSKKVSDQKIQVTSENLGELYRPLTLKFNYPLRPSDSIPIQIIAKKKMPSNDTIYTTIHIPDTFICSIPILYTWEEKVPYSITIPDSCFFAYNGTTNDTIKINFTSKSIKDYGALHITYQVKKKQYPYIVSLLDANNRVITRNTIYSSETIHYLHLPAGNYKIKVIEDNNANGKWDTGNYRLKRQPERIFAFPKILSIRGYWEIEEVFELN